jgi:hypothetical protein
LGACFRDVCADATRQTKQTARVAVRLEFVKYKDFSRRRYLGSMRRSLLISKDRRMS